jgi:hypothetical protein
LVYHQIRRNGADVAALIGPTGQGFPKEDIMKGLADREKAFEAEFSRNQELAFRVTARRNRLFGLWAATRLGLPQGETADAYAKTVVEADFKVPGDADVIQKVQSDLAAKNITVTEADLRAELARAGAEVRRQLSQS